MSHTGEPADELGLTILAAQPSGAAVARVDETGERSAALSGRLVLVPAIEPCGQCDVCRRGGAAACPGARRREPLAGRARVSSRWLVPLGDGLDLPVPAAAAAAGDLATAYTLYARTGLGPREPAIVTGATAVARFLVEILIAKSITPTVVADPAHAEWCTWLRARGVHVAAAGEDVRAAVAEVQAAQGQGARPWRILATADVAVAASLAGPRATLTVLAPPGVALPSLPGELLAREVTVIGVAGAHPDLIVEAAAMCARGEVDLGGGVTTDGADVTRAHVIALA